MSRTSHFGVAVTLTVIHAKIAEYNPQRAYIIVEHEGEEKYLTVDASLAIVGNKISLIWDPRHRTLTPPDPTHRST